LTDLSIVIPTWNEAATIRPLLQDLKDRGGAVELIVVDGGSRDDTVAQAKVLADRVLASAPGRARQMNAGLAQAKGRVVLFLHADTWLPPDAFAAVMAIADDPRHDWGRFDVRITGQSPLLPVVAGFMNLRSRLTGVATGDQAIFAKTAVLARIGGLPDVPIMEDIALSKALRRISPPLCLRQRLSTSGRRWDANGALRTIGVMWVMRLGYFLGVTPAKLARLYARLRKG
jgi:rSAM/selenodomain-associated transferase 2